MTSNTPPQAQRTTAASPVELVNRAFGAVPYGASIDFQRISEADTRDIAYTKIASNIDRLADTLRSVAEEHEARTAKLADHIAAIQGLSMAFDLIDAERTRRASAAGLRPPFPPT